jgi:uncharacterized protein YjiS (DUF1127 family)
MPFRENHRGNGRKTPSPAQRRLASGSHAAGGSPLLAPPAAISDFFLKDQLLELCKFDIAATQQYCFSYVGSSLFRGQITGASRLLKKEPAMFANLVRLIREWKRYNQSLSELSRLGDRELADIGISRSDIHRVAWNAAHPH